MKLFKKINPFYLLFLVVFFFIQTACGQLQFIENKGQWEKQVDFKSDFETGSFFLQKKGFTVLLNNPKDLEIFSGLMHGHAGVKNSSAEVGNNGINNDKLILRSHAYRVNFIAASNDMQILPDKILPTYNNYFIGNDHSKWQGNCKIYQAITYKNMYPNIDVRYYTDAGRLKYDLIVHPGGDINAIGLKYEGADKLSIKNKELIINTTAGESKELYPYTYQVQNGARQILDCKYVLKDNIVRFKVKDYSPGATIVIDPTLIFCSFTGSTVDNWGYTATPGPDGSFFAGGIAFGNGFPVSLGAFSQTFNGGVNDDAVGKPYDISIIKFSSNGVNRIYATYLGGNGNEQPHSMICDAQGNLIVAGRSNSGNYPTTVPQIGTGGSYDIVITKFNAAGNGLIGSIKMGGTADDGVNIKSKYVPVNPPSQTDGAFETRRNYGDDARSEVILDGNNNILLASCTQSSNFPVLGSSIQSAFGGGRQDGVIIKFTPDLSTLLFSTFYGGSGSDACFVLALNPLTNKLYVAGATTSSDLPGDKTGALNAAYQGGVTDGFITEVNPDGSGIIKTTYAGTAGNDLIYGIQFDKFGFPYIMGATTGNWPVFNAAFSNTGSKQFISKLKPDLSGFVYSTTFGTNSPIPNISPVAFLVDRCQNVYVSGWGGIFNQEDGYPCAGTSGMPVTANATQSTTDGNDFYFFVLEKNAASQLYGSFFGQYGGFTDHVDGGTSRFDADGIIYQAICASCGNSPGVIFPTTPGVWASQKGAGASCNEAAVKIEMNFTGIGAHITASIDGVIDTVGCVPVNIVFTDIKAQGKKYIWDFGDHSPRVTTIAPNNSTSHIYTQVGKDTAMVISIDSSTCNISDTAYITVKIGNNIVVPDFVFTKIGDCHSHTFQFDNTTTAALPHYTSNTFLWDFGDGSPKERAGFITKMHTYASTGAYNVTLMVDDTTFCNAPRDTTKTVRLSENVKAIDSVLSIGCVPYSAKFQNNSLGGTDFIWRFGDGSTSVEISPTHTYNNIGTYHGTLIAIDTSTCNKIDSISFTITVYEKPIAIFNYQPNPPEENRPTRFSNSSQGAVSYIWDFGDGETSTEVDPTHQFNATQTYHVCLKAINAAGCADDTCLDVAVKVLPLLDVPNAFTPGKFGVNSIIKVVGFGIGKMDWKIYNRWGQLVFVTNNHNQGWDGTFKGALQPMDVYTYTLDVEFTDGKKFKTTGDITLLR